MAKPTIVLVDKDKILVDLLTRALSSEDIAAFGTTSADEALRLIDLHSPALIVVDPSIPGGFPLLDAAERVGAKVLAVSGLDTADSIRAAGVIDIVDRNAGLEDLVVAIRRLMNGPVKVMGKDDGVGVLVADDENELRGILREFLSRKGYNVRTAKNGVEAVDTIDKDSGIQVVLLDVSMPEMGGMEALGHIMDRENPPSVLMMTAVADREVARQALRTGALDYILKPFDFPSIEAGIMACLSRKEYQKQPWWKRLARRQ